ncbi:aldose 1-epimerase [Sphingomonas sp. LT1P40]|uniref:aldose 1-epimerase n=1 Tax=Alteristakelama amylovorans TaxID=3096166 RepID=UPI002FC8A962
MDVAAHDWELVVLPELGGAVGALRHERRDMLRPAPDGTTDPLATACFPLVPYANRIARGRFHFGGQVHSLPLNFADHPHSLHGLGWQAVWAVTDISDSAVTLAHGHDGGAGWPWPYRAEQRFTLALGAATLAISLTSLADEPVPGGLGLHPYFPCDAATRLTGYADRVWRTDETLLPDEPADAAQFGDWRTGAAVAGETLIDNAYDGWDGLARIDQHWGSIDLTARGAPVFHLYRPPGVDFFCFEAVSHLPDAINRGGMTLLQPDETMTLEMTLAIR